MGPIVSQCVGSKPCMLTVANLVLKANLVGPMLLYNVTKQLAGQVVVVTG